jgi:hypothetical protein
MSLFDQVVNESYKFDGSVDAAIEAEIDARVSDAPESMIDYVGECQMGMLALEAAIYAAEGHQAVAYMHAREAEDEATMESVQVAMEGMIGDAWEKLKEWVKKAYAAIKAFVLKYWNKLKGYVDIFKGMIGKYADVLRDKDVNIEVEWIETLNIEEGAKKMSSIVQDLSGAFTKLAGGNLNRDDQVYQKSVEDFKKEIMTAIYGSGYENNGIKTGKKNFGEIRRQALDAAEIGNARKYIDFVLKLGETSQKETLAAIDNAKKSISKQAEKNDQESEKKTELQRTNDSDKLAGMRKLSNTMIAINKMGDNALVAAANLKIKLSVKACRAAIMASRTGGEKEEEKTPTTAAGTGESTSFEGILATIM